MAVFAPIPKPSDNAAISIKTRFVRVVRGHTACPARTAPTVRMSPSRGLLPSPAWCCRTPAARPGLLLPASSRSPAVPALPIPDRSAARAADRARDSLCPDHRRLLPVSLPRPQDPRRSVFSISTLPPPVASFRRRKAVVLELPVQILPRRFPFGRNPAPSLQTVERRV